MTNYLINLHVDTNYEISYLKNRVLCSIDYVEIKYENINTITFDDNLIVIYSGGVKENLLKLNKIAENKKIHLLIHLSDETLSHDIGIYKHAEKILRNYYNPRLKNKNILTIPIGYKNTLEREQVGEIELMSRAYVWSFVGTMKNERYQMIKILNKIKLNFQHITDSFWSPDHLGSIEYRNVLLNSIFVPCPSGFYNFETFRILEALENYSIPIFKRRLFFDHLNSIYNENIFLTSYSWRGVRKKMLYYLDHPNELEEYSNNLFTWYENYLTNLSFKVESFLKLEIDENKKRNIEKKFSFEILLFNLSNITFSLSNLKRRYLHVIKKIIKKFTTK